MERSDCAGPLMPRRRLYLAAGVVLAAVSCAVTAPTPQASAFVMERTRSSARAVDLGTLGGRNSGAYVINDRRQVAGVSETHRGTRHAFVWDQGVMTDLGTLGGSESSVKDINQAGDVVGTSTTATGQTHAYLWRHHHMTDLGTLGGPTSDAAAITDTGLIAGTSTLPNGRRHAFLWGRGHLTDLGTVGRWQESSAADVNEAGDVV